MMDNKGLVKLLVVSVCIWGFYKIITALAPGSYPYAETYSLNATEEEIIQDVKQLKKAHSQLSAPSYLTDGRSDSSNHWYHVYFTHAKSGHISKTWIRFSEKNKTTFAFVAVSQGSGWGDWKYVNKDFSTLDNGKLIRIFKQEILNPVKQQLESNTAAHNTSLLP